jgi:hypothetical protein
MAFKQTFQKLIIKVLFFSTLGIFYLFGMFSLFLGGSVIYRQMLSWLKTGEWTAQPLLAHLPAFCSQWLVNLEWLGIRKILYLIVTLLPFSITMIILGIVFFIIGSKLSSSVASNLEKKWKVDADI